MNIVHHVCAVVGYVSVKHTHQRRDETYFPLPVPIGLNTTLDSHQSIAAAQFGGKRDPSLNLTP
jgi:hypothetical protein